MNLIQKYNSISDKQSFSEFLKALASDIKTNPNEWENSDLESFLEAMSAWLEDSEGYYRNQGNTAPTLNWKTLADMFMAAKIYE